LNFFSLVLARLIWRTWMKGIEERQTRSRRPCLALSLQQEVPNLIPHPAHVTAALRAGLGFSGNCPRLQGARPGLGATSAAQPYRRPRAKPTRSGRGRPISPYWSMATPCQRLLLCPEKKEKVTY